MRKFLKNISRRRFIQIFGSVAAIASSTGPLHAQDRVSDADNERAILVRMLQLLFPHGGIDSTVYTDMATQVIKVANRDSKTMTVLSEGLQHLNSLTQGTWLELLEAEQKAALEKITGTVAFGLIRVNALEYLYRDPRAWRVVGYEGSAIEFGGYSNRGFDDIDWLPES